jgi:Flp pilus assembly protein TadG
MLRNSTRYVLRRARDISRFRRARGGATAVEFALIAPAFLAIVIALLEVSYFLFAQQTLQTAAVEAGRLFMTSQGPSQASLLATNSNICKIIQPLLSCGSVMVDVQPYDTFSAADAGTPTLTYDGQGNVTNTWSYAAGTPGQVVVVRLMYQLTTIRGPLGFVLSNLSNGMMLAMGVTAVRVEPSATAGG